MGISTNARVWYGTQIDKDDPDFEELSKALYKMYDNGQYVVEANLGGMDGYPITLGADLYDSGDARYGEMEESAEWHNATAEWKWAEYQKRFKEVLPEFAHIVDVYPKYFAFVDYS